LTAAPSSGQHSLEGERFAEKGEAMTDARVLGEWLDRVRRGSLSRRDTSPEACWRSDSRRH